MYTARGAAAQRREGGWLGPLHHALQDVAAVPKGRVHMLVEARKALLNITTTA